ncbi:mycothiol system anti-sigma-R factor [Corynebacterium sp. Q4381]|uniref:mycothiol system anti-sigma-R factor n=1 Tax=Corynebacterium sp. Marseille-Q4381 TaxID=3121597 RepID=UPI002FE5805B
MATSDPNRGCNCADCDEDAQQLLNELFDPETTAARSAEILRAIEACPECFGQFESEKAVRSLVRDCCGGQKAPEPLRERIIASISVTAVSYTEVRYR